MLLCLFKVFSVCNSRQCIYSNYLSKNISIKLWHMRTKTICSCLWKHFFSLKIPHLSVDGNWYCAWCLRNVGVHAHKSYKVFFSIIFFWPEQQPEVSEVSTLNAELTVIVSWWENAALEASSLEENTSARYFSVIVCQIVFWSKTNCRFVLISQSASTTG